MAIHFSLSLYQADSPVRNYNIPTYFFGILLYDMTQDLAYYTLNVGAQYMLYAFVIPDNKIYYHDKESTYVKFKICTICVVR